MYSEQAERYIERFSCKQDPVLDWVEKQTHLRTNYSRMLCGPVVGKFLEMFVKALSPERILEIGTFTGYSSICLARGLGQNGHLDSVELNDELEDLILQGYRKAGLEEKITLYIGDAKQTVSHLGHEYDLVFMDANKREYLAYYELALEHLRVGGYILADNVLWDGKVYAEPLPKDAQTAGIYSFNEFVASDSRVENVIVPLRDGMNLIRKLPVDQLG